MFDKAIVALRTYFVSHFPLILLLLIAAPFLLIRLEQAPAPWFDEGLNLLAVRTLAEDNVFGLPTAGGIRADDPAIQTGPPMIMLLAELHKLFGANIGIMRFAIVVFSVAALVALYGLTHRLYNRFAAFLAIALLLSLPVWDSTVHVVPMSRQVLGEMPTIFLLTLGLIILTGKSLRWPQQVLVGLCFGFAITIKSQVLVILISSIGVWLLYCLLYRREMFWPWVLIGVVMVSVYGVNTLWRQVMTEGHNVESGLTLLEGARIHLFPFRFLQNLSSRITLWILSIAIVSIAGVYIRRKFFPTSPTRSQSVLDVELFLVIFVSLWMIWFGVVSIGWPRYGFIGHVFSLTLLASTVAALWRYRLPINRMAYAAVIAATGVALLIFQTPVMQNTQGDHFYEAVHYIQNDIPTDAVIVSWELPLAYLVDQPFEYPTTDVTNSITAAIFNNTSSLITYDPLTYCPDFLLYGSFSVDRDVIQLENLRTTLFESGLYQLYPLEESC